MAWIELHQSVFHHRKTMAAADALDLPEVHLVGHLAALWTWGIDNAQDGALPDSDRIIARGAQWTGDAAVFVSTLIDAGFIDEDQDGQRSIHDWQESGGKLIEKRRENAEKQARYRDRHKTGPVTSPTPTEHVTVTLPSRNALEKRREEKSREEDKGLSSESRAREEPAEPEKPKRAERIPDGFDLSDQRFEYAASKGFDAARINVTFEKFTTYWRRVGKPMKDWDAGWRNWVLNEMDRAPALANGRASPVSTADDFRDLADRLGAQPP